MTFPPSGGMPNAVIAVWGKLQLVSLDPESIQTLASGGSLKAGLLIDYFGDFRLPPPTKGVSTQASE